MPVVLLLVALSFAFVNGRSGGAAADGEAWYSGTHFWGIVHGSLILAASVGITVAFLASVMYLIQANRLRAKAPPLGGVKMLSLERLEVMNRRAVNWAFPFLTLGLVLGVLFLGQYPVPSGEWLSLKVVGTVGLWVVFVVLLYLRYAAHVPGRRLALLTVAAFGLMVVVLVAPHPFAQGAGP